MWEGSGLTCLPVTVLFVFLLGKSIRSWVDLGLPAEISCWVVIQLLMVSSTVFYYCS